MSVRHRNACDGIIIISLVKGLSQIVPGAYTASKNYYTCI